MQVHATGKFKYNTLLNMLRLERASEDIFRNKTNLFVSPIAVHRLDRLTSGIVIFAKTKKAATRFGNEIAAGKWEKDYIARVRGNFPTYFVMLLFSNIQ